MPAGLVPQDPETCAPLRNWPTTAGSRALAAQLPILEILDEIGLADRLHQRPHVKMYGPTISTSQGPVMLFDMRRLLKTRFPYIMWMPQAIFLDFLATAGREHASFQLVMGANVQRLLAEDGAVRGVRYRDGNGSHDDAARRRGHQVLDRGRGRGGRCTSARSLRRSFRAESGELPHA